MKDQGVDGRMGSKWTLGRLVGGVEWIHLAQDRGRWRAVVNAVMNLVVLAPRSRIFSYIILRCDTFRTLFTPKVKIIEETFRSTGKPLSC
jgi:hypothetical protein